MNCVTPFCTTCQYTRSRKGKEASWSRLFSAACSPLLLVLCYYSSRESPFWKERVVVENQCSFSLAHSGFLLKWKLVLCCSSSRVVGNTVLPIWVTWNLVLLLLLLHINIIACNMQWREGSEKTDRWKRSVAGYFTLLRRSLSPLSTYYAFHWGFLLRYFSTKPLFSMKHAKRYGTPPCEMIRC